MRISWVAWFLVMLLLPVAVGVLSVTAPAARAASSSGAVSGNITGPTVLAFHGAAKYTIEGTGGPAVSGNGTIAGNLTWYAAVTGPNTTGVDLSPGTGRILVNAPGTPTLTVSNVSEVLTITVEIASTRNASNASTNFTYSVHVVQPYVLSTTLYNLGGVTLNSFPVAINLDGVPVGSVTVPQMTPHGTYRFTFQYATLTLPPGVHTFTVSLASVHGLVRFADGTTLYSASFDVPGPPPSYTLWYVTGAIAFIGALLIFGARVGARRRGASKK
jgi:hypothetical protein